MMKKYIILVLFVLLFLFGCTTATIELDGIELPEHNVTIEKVYYHCKYPNTDACFTLGDLFENW